MNVIYVAKINKSLLRISWWSLFPYMQPEFHMIKLGAIKVTLKLLTVDAFIFVCYLIRLIQFMCSLQLLISGKVPVFSRGIVCVRARVCVCVCVYVCVSMNAHSSFFILSCVCLCVCVASRHVCFFLTTERPPSLWCGHRKADTERGLHQRVTSRKHLRSCLVVSAVEFITSVEDICWVTYSVCECMCVCSSGWSLVRCCRSHTRWRKTPRSRHLLSP